MKAGCAMARVEGRMLSAAHVAEIYVGERIVLRVDDRQNPEFWLTLTFTPEEFGAVMDRYCDWLFQSEQLDALNRVMFKKD